PIFSLLQKKGGIDERMMYQTFNMGLGMVLAVDPKEAERALQVIRESGEQGALVGEIIKGEKGIDLC
ncbi:MAG: phosphoribosylformylglycinamidine cyclo-ligase, partial [Lachnospiraceae bacterium]|nr:phosphoribosylformylglycinamidine cyclo-ligase [Lachnospiraceae bacterium]